MYESFFGLKEKPFNLTPDPDFLYLNTRTREAFDEILYGIERREGFAVIVGDVGTGKTTLSCALIEKIEGHESIRTVLIQNPMLSELDILRSILQNLGVSPEDPKLQRLGSSWTRDLSKKELIDCLNVFLAERAREDAFTVLIIDEAQNLSLEMLEQLRLLSNLETTKKKLLQIIFLGQLELERKLAKLRLYNAAWEVHKLRSLHIASSRDPSDTRKDSQPTTGGCGIADSRDKRRNRLGTIRWSTGIGRNQPRRSGTMSTSRPAQRAHVRFHEQLTRCPVG